VLRSQIIQSVGRGFESRTAYLRIIKIDNLLNTTPVRYANFEISRNVCRLSSLSAPASYHPLGEVQ
jgi:hypothetical protein